MANVIVKLPDKVNALIAKNDRTTGFTDSRTPNIRETRDVWLKITGSTTVSTFIWEYTCDVYVSPFSTHSISTGAKARNTWEIGNTGGTASGYGISSDDDPCDLTSITAIPNSSWHRSLGTYYLESTSKWVFVFTERNDPYFEDPA